MEGSGQVDEEVQENNPRPWEAAEYKLSREGQWQVSGQGAATGLKATFGCRHRRLAEPQVVEVTRKWLV